MNETITWIPVAERLPDDDCGVLLCADDENGGQCVDQAYHDGDCWRWGFGGRVSEEVIAWAEWPRGPKERNTTHD